MTETEAAERPPIPNTRFYRIMARGHLNRTGHKLTGYLEPATRADSHVFTPDDGATIWRLRRTCCPEEGELP